ncbi:MAG: hypothetical protein IBX39_01650 [Candidatus Methanoperedenaceae archaeon]|nr:hypothetical protein [Candidatus Methanoperedenaceae archaeon]MDW7726731.1 hypothetical protein [Candidatus Methanoperedens sp.]
MADDDNKYVGDEFEEEDENFVDEEAQEIEGLYDLVLPPGVPQKVIMEAMQEFNLESTIRKYGVKTRDEIEDENLLVLRGELDAVNNAQIFIYNKMKELYNYSG